MPNRNVYGAMFAIFFLASKNSEKESYYNNLFKQFIFRNKGINPYTVGIYWIMILINNKYFRYIGFKFFGNFIKKLSAKRKVVDIFNRF